VVKELMEEEITGQKQLTVQDLLSRMNSVSTVNSDFCTATVPPCGKRVSDPRLQSN